MTAWDILLDKARTLEVYHAADDPGAHVVGSA
jgi:hypothetical protein